MRYNSRVVPAGEHLFNSVPHTAVAPLVNETTPGFYNSFGFQK